MITDAIIREVKYPPELIPDSWFGAVPLNGESAPPVLDLRRFSPYVLKLVNIQTLPNANVDLRARYGNTRVNENTAAMLSYLDGTPAVTALPGAWELTANDILYYNFFGVAAVANHPTQYGVWAFKHTVAHKMLYGINLTPDELAICAELGIANSVEKGVLPLPISQQIEREYPVVGEETHTRNINIAAVNTIYTVEVLYAQADEFIVLTRVAVAPGTAAQNIQLIIDRDEDANFAQLATFPLALTAGGEIACFVPAMTEIRLTTTAAVAPGAHLFRYTFKRIKLTNILRVRFGLVSQDEVTADLWKKVKAGVL